MESAAEPAQTPFRDLPSLAGVRAALAAPPARQRTPLWAFVLAAAIAAVVGVGSASLMILGPTGGTRAAVHTASDAG
jgi:hypothetical protein